MKRLTSYFTALFVPVFVAVLVASSGAALLAQAQKTGAPTPIDLNTADAKALAAVPGIGDKLAADIIKARPFKTVEDLKKVSGIGDGKKFDTLKPYFMVAKSTPPATSGSKTSSSKAPKLAPGEKININTATAEELDKLPDVGPTKAKAIIDYRNSKGKFTKIEDIMKVTGIKQGTFAKIKDLIVVK